MNLKTLNLALFVILVAFFASCHEDSSLSCDEEFRRNYSGLNNVTIIDSGNSPEARYLISERDSQIFPLYDAAAIKLIYQYSNGLQDTVNFYQSKFIHGTDLKTAPFAASYGCSQFVTEEIIESQYLSDNAIIPDMSIRLIGGGPTDGKMQIRFDSTFFGCSTLFYGNPVLNNLEIPEFHSGGKTFYNVFRSIGNDYYSWKTVTDTLYYHHNEGIIQISFRNGTKLFKP